VVPSGIAETHPPGPPAEAVAVVALAKAREVARTLAASPDETAPPGTWRPGSGEDRLSNLGAGRIIVLGADTEVVLDGRLLGKPRDAGDAARMLRELRDRVHEVITGVALVEAGSPAPREETAAVITRVRMRPYTGGEIEEYVASGEPLDKAGGYAVQGRGSRLVAEVIGCFTNVVGLPMTTTRRLLERWGAL
jgi:septum formation protein